MQDDLERKNKAREADRKYKEKNKEVLKERSKKYRKDNAKKIKDSGKIYYEKNKERYAAFGKKYREANRENIKTYRKLHADEYKEYRQTFNGRYSSYKYDAKKRGIDFKLTEVDFKLFWQQPCSYCGDDIPTVGVDRIDSKGIYELENCISCCFYCNQMKLDRTKEGWVLKMKQIISHLEKQEAINMVMLLTI